MTTGWNLFTSYIPKSEDVGLMAALYVQLNLARILIRVECFICIGLTHQTPAYFMCISILVMKSSLYLRDITR